MDHGSVLSSRFSVLGIPTHRVFGQFGSECGFLGQNKVSQASCDASILAFGGGSDEIFFISIPLKALTGAGFEKRLSQNLVFKELRSKNIENK
jgi:hypothetical protein